MTGAATIRCRRSGGGDQAGAEIRRPRHDRRRGCVWPAAQGAGAVTITGRLRAAEGERQWRQWLRQPDGGACAATAGHLLRMCPGVPASATGAAGGIPRHVGHPRRARGGAWSGRIPRERWWRSRWSSVGVRP